MNYTATEQRLMDQIATWDIIDCHEHLPPEHVRTDSPQDLFTLFSHYTRHDLLSAGMAPDSESMYTWGKEPAVYTSLFDYDTPLEKRWEMFRPYWRRIRHGSYARAALLTAAMVYGVDDINDRTYHILSARIAAENTPGIYQRILCDRCRIRASMTQCMSTALERPLVPVMLGWALAGIRTRKALDKRAAGLDLPQIKGLDDCLELLRRQLDQWVAEGTIGIKITSHHCPPPDQAAAAASLKKLLDGKELAPDASGSEPLEDFLTHHMIDMAAERQLVVACHAGIWGDFRTIDSKHMLTLAAAHPRARFDLYHLGMPSVRDTIVVGKNLANVYLNLCWTHVISQVQTCSGIDEMLDQVPVNKVLAFGGDYGRPVEKVVGHLHMARENFARVFGARIDRGMMGMDEALEILKLWFWDNPLALYSRLEV